MRRLAVFTALALVAFSFTSRSAHAILAFDQNVTPDVIFGSGNANGSFTVDTTGNLELGLRAKVRFPAPMNVFNSDGFGTYTFNAGHNGASLATPLWSFEWAINTNVSGAGTDFLNSFTYLLEIDYDPGIGSTNFRSFDPINPSVEFPAFDHSIGDNSTTDATDSIAVSVPDYASLIGSNNVAQNSWRLDFFNDATHVSMPDVAGEYDIRLTAFSGATQVGQTTIVVAAVPEASQILCLTMVFCAFTVTTLLRRNRMAEATA